MRAMRLLQWWRLLLTTRRWRRQAGKRKAERARLYREIPNARQIIRHLELPKGQSDSIMAEVKEAMCRSEALSRTIRKEPR